MPASVDEEVAASQTTPIDNLSVKLPNVLPSLLYADCIESKAWQILNTPQSLVPYPSFNSSSQPTKETKFMVERKGGMFYTVKANANKKVQCDCKGFRWVDFFLFLSFLFESMTL